MAFPCPAAPPEAASSRFPASEGWKPLFNGKGLEGWKFRNPGAKTVWVACDDVRLDPSNPAQAPPVGAGGGPGAVLLCGDDGRGSDIMTAEDFYDYQLHVEFTVPKGSNSGVYNRGLFEIQVFDSFGVPKLGFHDCGALYERAIPRENHAKAPGEWQTFDITMKGKKISLIWNGESVFHDMDVRYGETDRAAFERLNQENAGKPEALQVKLRRRTGSTSASSAKGAPGPASTGPTGPARSSSRATTAGGLSQHLHPPPGKVNTRHTPRGALVAGSSRATMVEVDER